MPDDRVFRLSDPQGFYATLGVGRLADGEEIRAAFRRRAKLVHPDVNPSEDAPQRFQLLIDAYLVLRDPRRRRRYDAACSAPPPLGAVDPDADSPQPLACSRCGRVSAQPRYIIFRRVKSSLLSAQCIDIEGIFCRVCADRTAIMASTLTWLQGWWSPMGPVRSIAALYANLKGGDRPKGENFRVLLHQARAFLAYDEPEIAHALAGQGVEFAAGRADRARLAEVAAAAGTPTRRLRARWSPWGLALLVQGLPLAALAFALGLAASVVVLQGATDDVSAAITVQPARIGEVRYVAIELLKLRQRPGDEQPVIELLDRFTTVRVTDIAESGEWARIVTPSGLAGYVPSRYLYAGAGEAPRRRWCAGNRGAPPRTGDVLLRRTGGDHRLTVSNPGARDAVVRLKTNSGQTLLAFYVGAGETAQVGDIPDGNFRLVYASGGDFSRACGVFLDEMQAFGLPAQSFQPAGGGQELELALPAPGETFARASPLPVNEFLDN